MPKTPRCFDRNLDHFLELNGSRLADPRSIVPGVVGITCESRIIPPSVDSIPGLAALMAYALSIPLKTGRDIFRDHAYALQSFSALLRAHLGEQQIVHRQHRTTSASGRRRFDVIVMRLNSVHVSSLHAIFACKLHQCDDAAFNFMGHCLPTSCNSVAGFYCTYIVAPISSAIIQKGAPFASVHLAITRTKF